MAKCERQNEERDKTWSGGRDASYPLVRPSLWTDLPKTIASDAAPPVGCAPGSAASPPRSAPEARGGGNGKGENERQDGESQASESQECESQDGESQDGEGQDGESQDGESQGGRGSRW